MRKFDTFGSANFTVANVNAGDNVLKSLRCDAVLVSRVKNLSINFFFFFFGILIVATKKSYRFHGDFNFNFFPFTNF